MRDDYEFGLTPAMVGRTAVHVASRRIWLELRKFGVTPDQVNEWNRDGWLPHARWHPDIKQLMEAPAIKEAANVGNEAIWWADPQIIIRLPDVEPFQFDELGHVDKTPGWALDALVYKDILVVELTDTPPNGGGTWIHVERGGPIRPVLKAGDVLRMGGRVRHSGSPNRTGQVRVAVILRTLVEREA